MASNWFKRLMRQTADRAARKRAGRLRLEVLEGRVTPANVVWDGGGTTNNWSDRFNWVGDSAPVNGDSLVFPDRAGVDLTSLSNFNNITNLAVNSIRFEDSGYTLDGNAVNLGANGITFDDPTNPTGDVVNLGLILDVTRNFTVVQANVRDALRVNGQVSGAGGIIKDGAGFLGLAGNNLYTGITTVGQGFLTVESNSALGATGFASRTEVLAGATLELDPFASGFTVNETAFLNGNGVNLAGALHGTSSSAWAGPIFLASDSRIVGATLFVITGVVSGAADADLTLANSVNLAGANTYPGFTTIESGLVTVGNATGLGVTTNGTRVLAGGALNLVGSSPVNEPLFLNGDGNSSGPAATGALTVSAGAPAVSVVGDIVIESDAEIFVAGGEQLTLTGNLSGDAGATLKKDGDGELRYAIASGKVVSFAGTTLIGDGLLTLNTPGSNVVLGSLVIDPDDVSDVATVRLLGLTFAGTQVPLTGSNQIADNVTVSLRPGGVLDLNDNNEAVGGLNMTEGIVQTGIGTLTLAGNVTTNASTNSAVINGRLNLGPASRTFTVANGAAGGDLVINAVVSGAAAGLVKAGDGTLTLSGANTFDGAAIVNGGFLVANNAAALGSTAGSTTVNAGATLRVQGPFTVPEAINLNGSGVAGIGALLNTFNNTLTGTIRLNSDSTINVEAGSTLTLAGQVRGQAVGVFEVGHDLTKIGDGTLVFTGSGINTNTGDTRVFDGTLVLNKSVANGAVLGNLVVGDGDGGEAVRLDAGNQILDGRTVTVNEAVFNLNGNAETIGGLDLTGGQVFALGEPLTVNGNVTSHASPNVALVLGSLSLGDGPAGTVRAFTVEDGAAAVDLAIAGTLTDGASSAIGLDKAGAGTLLFNGSLFGEGVNPNAYGGLTRVLDGELQLNHAAGVNAIPGSLVVGDGSGLPASARVVLNSDEQIPNNATVTVNRDGLFDLNGNDERISNLVLTGGRVETGTGTLGVTTSVRTNADPQTAEINGNLELVPRTILLDDVTFDVADDATNPVDLLVNAVVSGLGDLVRTGGGGRLVLSAVNTLTGQTVVNHGVLQLLAGASLASSPVLVNTTDANVFSTVFVAGGTVLSLDVVRGVVTPSGPFTVLQDLDFAPAGFATFQGVLDVQLNGTAPGQFAQITANGIDLGNQTTQLQVRIAPGFDPQPGDTFEILTNTSNQLTSGRFVGLAADGATFNAIGENGSVPFSIDYTAGDGNEVAITRNTPAMIRDVEITRELDEGGVATFRGRLVDPDVTDQLFLRVNWGDGSGVETFHPGRDPFTLFHRYRDDDPSTTSQDDYVVTFTWGDGNGEQRSDTRLVTVHNVAPVVHAGGDAIVRLGATFRRSGFFSDPGKDRWEGTVDFGDGSGVFDLRLRDGRFNLEHRYTQPGHYQVTVRVVDDDGGVGEDTFFVTVEARNAGARLADAAFALLGSEGKRGDGLPRSS